MSGTLYGVCLWRFPAGPFGGSGSAACVSMPFQFREFERGAHVLIYSRFPTLFLGAAPSWSRCWAAGLCGAYAVVIHMAAVAGEMPHNGIRCDSAFATQNSAHHFCTT